MSILAARGGGMDERDQSETRVKLLLARVVRGDEAALEQLYRLYASAVFAFALGRVGDRGVAEEVAADTWLGCWRSAAAFRGDCRVLTWLLSMAKRQASMRTRRSRPVLVAFDESTENVADGAAGPAESLLAAAGVNEVLAALDALPGELAETVRLAWLYELSYAEIARVMDVPPGTVKSRVFRARALLQASLGGEYE